MKDGILKKYFKKYIKVYKENLINKSMDEKRRYMLYLS